MKRRARLTRNGNRMSEAKFRAWVRSLLRSGSMRWGAKNDALESAAAGRGINPHTGRMAKLYRCERCGGKSSRAGVQVDHKQPVVPLSGWVSWDDFINRLFCEVDGYQVLCKRCHDLKTKSENKQR